MISEDDHIIQIMPAGGWRYKEKDQEGKVADTGSIVGWGLRRDGFVVPLTHDVDSGIATEDAGVNTEVYHPSSTWENGPEQVIETGLDL